MIDAHVKSKCFYFYPFLPYQDRFHTEKIWQEIGKHLITLFLFSSLWLELILLRVGLFASLTCDDCLSGDVMRCNKASHTALKILRSSAKINCSHLTPLLWEPPTLLWWHWPIRSCPQLTLTNERPALGHVTWDGDPGPGTDLSCHGDGKHITHHNHHDVI